MYEQALQLEFKATNNKAEYEALLSRLQLVQKMHIQDLKAFSDSQLIVGYINDSYEARD